MPAEDTSRSRRQQIYQMLRPGGLVAVTEPESFPRFLTDPAGTALEERIHSAIARARDEAGMHMHENWPARLAEAGFAVESERRFAIALRPPPDSPAAAPGQPHQPLACIAAGAAARAWGHRASRCGLGSRIR